jgi:hypothetical protein
MRSQQSLANGRFAEAAYQASVPKSATAGSQCFRVGPIFVVP